MSRFYSRWKKPLIRTKILSGLTKYPGYLKDLFTYRKMEGAEFIKLSDTYPCLFDKTSTTGVDSHYFYQDLWAFKKILQHNPIRHIDVGSNVVFVGFLTGITHVSFVDIRPLKVSNVSNLESIKGSILEMPFEDNSVDVCISVSCIEHIGTPRYSSSMMSTDRMIVEEIFRILKPGGIFIITIPFGEARILSTHRVYDDNSLQQLTEGFNELDREIYVPYNDEDVLLHYRISTKEKALARHHKHSYSVIALKLQKP